ncbi:MAG: GNAT family N-acetyltransferase [Christensenellales bacterium]|jgi:GNAT superfamily N-acetyltransferase
MDKHRDELLGRYTKEYFAYLGYDHGKNLQAVVEEGLSIAYPLMVKEMGGKTVVCLAEEIEEAIPEIEKMPAGSLFDDFANFLFEPETPFEKDFSYIGVHDLRTVGEVELPAGISVRRLDREDKQDKKLFAQFYRTIAKKEQALAQVSLTDDYVLGLFLRGELVSAASSLMWNDIMDIGVATRPDKRGKGFGVLAVRKLCRLRAGENIAQYRCDKTNAASVRLMESAGFIPAAKLTGMILKI